MPSNASKHKNFKMFPRIFFVTLQLKVEKSILCLITCNMGVILLSESEKSANGLKINNLALFTADHVNVNFEKHPCDLKKKAN